MNSKLLYIIVLHFLTIHGVSAQWVQTGGPYGPSRIHAIFTNNNRIYAATSCGLHSTGSLTDKWDLKSTLQMTSSIKKGSMVYYGAAKTGIQRLDLSEPGFQPMSNGLNGVSVVTIKDGGTCLYAGIEGQGFASSMGYSGEWNFHTQGLPAETRYYPQEQGGGAYYVRYVNSIEIIDNTLYCGTHQGVYKANKDVLSWSRSGSGLPAAFVQVVKAMEGNLYACQGNNLYLSEDKGESWNLVHSFGSTISSFERMNDYLFITTLGSGIWMKNDNGSAWIPQNNGLTDLNVTTLTLIENTPVCGTERQGIFYFDGTSWVNHSTGIICSDIRTMGVTGNSIAANDREAVYLTNGNTSSWMGFTPAAEKNDLGYIATMGDKIFLSYESVDHTQHIKYLDGNNAWQNLIADIPFAGDDPYRMTVDSTRLYVFENGMLYFTDDLGATWGNLTLSNQFCNDIYDFTVYKHIPFAASCGVGELLRLSDNSTWGWSNSGLPNGREITSMAFSADALYAYSYTNGVYISRDNGQSWTKTSDGLYADWNLRSFAFYKDNLFVSTVRGVYYSSDFGQHWNLMNEGLKNSNVGPLVISNDTLYVGTRGNGVWKHDLYDFLPPKKDSVPQAKHIKIFPNPATAYVRFEFPDSDKAQVELLDPLGRKVIRTKLGQERQISIAGLSSGTYIIVITTDRYNFNSKLIIQRKD